MISLYNCPNNIRQGGINMRKRRVLAALMAAATGDLPDIIQVGGMQDSNTMQFMKEGHFLELTDMECLNNVVDEYKDAIKFQGKNYIVPISANFSGVFYNKDMFEEAGYQVPTTYDELITLAKDIQSKGEVPFLFPDKDAWTLVQCWEEFWKQN